MTKKTRPQYVLDRQHVVHVAVELATWSECLTVCGRKIKPTFIDNVKDWQSRCADCLDKEGEPSNRRA